MSPSKVALLARDLDAYGSVGSHEYAPNGIMIGYILFYLITKGLISILQCYTYTHTYNKHGTVKLHIQCPGRCYR